MQINTPGVPLTGMPGQPTVGSLTTAPAVGGLRSTITRYSWVNADVVALGAVTTGTIAVCTLAAKTVVKSARIVVTGTAAGTTTLTASLGRTGAAYIDYIVAKTVQASPNTVYGNIVADLGASLSALVGDLPSVTGSTVVNLQFISTISNLSAVTGSTGDIYLETQLLP